MKIQRCKGSYDLLPPDMLKFRCVEEVFSTCCQAWGYQEIRTPMLEYLHLFTSAGTLTRGMLNKVYSFLDWDGWSGERVVLRPDGTIPAARLYVDSLEAKGLARVFYVGNTFSFEETGRERREHWQCGAEIIGGSKPVADIELILLAMDVLRRLNLGVVEIQLSHAGLLKDLLRELGLSPGEQGEVFDQVLDGKIEALTEIRPHSRSLKRALSFFLNVRQGELGFLNNLRRSLARVLPGLVPSLEDFISIAELLDAQGLNYKVNIASGRGFEYYTGIIFQFYLSGRRLGGGGRYDDLVPLVGGGNVPASGFALDINQLMEYMGAVGQVTQPKVLIRTKDCGAQMLKLCFEVAGLLREGGYIAELDLGDAVEARWVLSVRSDAVKAYFLLVDRVKDKEFRLGSGAEVLNVLRES